MILEPNTVALLPISAGESISVSHVTGPTIYYGGSSVTTNSYTGTLTAGQTASLSGDTWFLATDHAEVFVNYDSGEANPISGSQRQALDEASGGALSPDNPVVSGSDGRLSQLRADHQSLIRPNSTVLTRFASGHGWGGGTDLNNTEQVLFGAQSAKVTSVNGSGTNLNSPNSLNIDLTGCSLWALIYCDDWSNLNNLAFYAANDNSITTYYAGYIQPTSNITGWRWIEFPWGSHASTAGSPAKTGINKLRLRFTSNSNVTVNAWVNAVGYRTITTYANGVVSFTFDDALASTYLKGLPVLSKYGYPATAYLITGRLDTGSYLTSAEARTLESVHGWEMGAHASGDAMHIDWRTLTADQLATEFTTLRSDLRGAGLASDNLATPYGYMNETISGTALQYFRSVRDVSGTASDRMYAPGQHEDIHALSYDSVTNTVTAIKAAMDIAKTQGYWLPLIFHEVTTAASSGESISSTDFASIVDYANSTGMAVRTVSQVLDLA